MSSKHQFRLERKYRRRAALKYARPKFTKAVKLAQWVIIGCEFLLRLRVCVGDWGRIVYRLVDDMHGFRGWMLTFYV